MIHLSSETRTNRLVIQGNTPEFVARHSGFEAIKRNGKEFHIDSCVRIIEERWRTNFEPPTANVSREPIGRANILLVDDDDLNRKMAKGQGHLAFGVSPNLTISEIYSFLYYEAERQGKMPGRPAVGF